MVRRSLVLVLSLIVMLLFGVSLSAQEYWAYGEFNQQYERFKYEITSYSYKWDYDLGEEVREETKQIQTLELNKIDDDTTKLTIAYTYDVPSKDLYDQFTFMGLSGLSSFMMSGGDWIGEIVMLNFYAEDMELEVGSIIQLYDGSRIRITEKQTVAGVEGYFFTRSERHQDDDGNRIDVKISEFVVAPDIGMPLLVRIYSGGEVSFIMELVEYSRQ